MKRKIERKRFGIKKINFRFIYYFILTFIFVLKIMLTLQTSTAGATLSYLENEERNIIKENFSLNDQLATTESLVRYESMASQLGFTKNINVEYLTVDDIFAKAQ